MTSNSPSIRPRKAFFTANFSAAESSVRKYRGTHRHQLKKKINKKYNKNWENFYLFIVRRNAAIISVSLLEKSI